VRVFFVREIERGQKKKTLTQPSPMKNGRGLEG